MLRLHLRFFNYYVNKMAEQELRYHFLILEILGVWTSSLNSVPFYSFYYFRRIFVLFFLTTFILSEIVDLSIQKNVKGITSNILSNTVVCCTILKVTTLLLNRKEIITLLNLLKLPFCLPKTPAEHKIINAYARRAWITLAFFLPLAFFTFVFQSGIPLVYGRGIKGRSLPYSIWHPYSIEPIAAFVLTYIFLFISAFFGMLLTVMMDCLISGFMVLTCSHLEILNTRLAHLRTRNDVKICVTHHEIILRFIGRIEKLFGPVLFIQFLLSMVNICSVIFVLFKSESRAGSIASGFYLTCMMVQLLLYCWNGNEIFLKSQNLTRASMEDSNWIALPMHLKKASLLIMIRTQKPIQVKARWLLTFSLDTFMMIVKSSYSAFNLLQHQHTSND